MVDLYTVAPFSSQIDEGGLPRECFVLAIWGAGVYYCVIARWHFALVIRGSTAISARATMVALSTLTVKAKVYQYSQSPSISENQHLKWIKNWRFWGRAWSCRAGWWTHGGGFSYRWRMVRHWWFVSSYGSLASRGVCGGTHGDLSLARMEVLYQRREMGR